MANKKLLDDRTLSSFGISIGTGIALESLFEPTTERYDVTRDIPKGISIDNYKIHYYNGYTLLRNIVSSVQGNIGEKEKLLKGKELLDTFMDELYVIANLYEGTKCKPKLFIPNYDVLYKSLNVNKEGTVVTKDYVWRKYLENMINSNRIKLSFPLDIIEHKYVLPSSTDNIIITTHIPVDLLNVNKIPKLKLLESHTGKLKTKTEWYSKYHPIGKLPMNVFPLSEELIYLLGDGHISLPTKIKTRRRLHEIAEEHKWTSYTNSSLIRTNLLQDKEFKELLKDLKQKF